MSLDNQNLTSSRSGKKRPVASKDLDATKNRRQTSPHQNAKNIQNIIGYWKWDDLIGETIAISKETSHIYATTPANLLHTWADIYTYTNTWVHPKDRQKYLAFAATKNGEAFCDYYSLIYRIMRADGKCRTIREISQSSKSAAEPHNHFGTIQDITEQSHDVLKLRESHRFLKDKIGFFFDKYVEGDRRTKREQLLKKEEFVETYMNLADSRQCYDETDPHFTLEDITYHFKTPDQARNIAGTLSAFCPDPSCAMIGICELLLNAIEHGNLGIGYKAKTKYLDQDNYHEEIDRRLASGKYRNKTARVSFKSMDGGVDVEVEDQGEGFDWQQYIEFDPSRMTDAHGRGIAMAANVCFQNLKYASPANKVIATIAF